MTAAGWQRSTQVSPAWGPCGPKRRRACCSLRYAREGKAFEGRSAGGGSPATHGTGHPKPRTGSAHGPLQGPRQKGVCNAEGCLGRFLQITWARPALGGAFHRRLLFERELLRCDCFFLRMVQRRRLGSLGAFAPLARPKPLASSELEMPITSRPMGGPRRRGGSQMAPATIASAKKRP